jgi:hypothetical protein
MSLTKNEHTIEIDGHTVAVTGTTGPVHARWTLLIDGEAVDTAKAAGDFTLRGHAGPRVTPRSRDTPEPRRSDRGRDQA